MALGGFGLNPFADVQHLGNNIGSVFGNQTNKTGSQPLTGVMLNSIKNTTYPEEGQFVSGTGVYTDPTGTVHSVLATPTSSGGGGGGGGSPTPSDPYSNTIFGSTSGYNQARSSRDAAMNVIRSSATDAAGAAGGDLNLGVLDTIHQLQLGQQGIDQQNVQNYLAKQQGMQGILASVGRGINSSGVTLANRNAGSSSAAQAFANAYGTLGRNQASQVGNQFAQNQQKIGTAQQEQNYQQSLAPQKVHQQITDTVNSIVSSAQQAMANLDSTAANASLPDRIAIEQEKENIRNQASQALQQYDAQIQSGVGGIAPTSDTQNIGQAYNLANAGTAPENAFSYTTNAPGQFQGGPFSSNLPLFTLNKSKDRALA